MTTNQAINRINTRISEMLATNAPVVMIYSYLSGQGFDGEAATSKIEEAKTMRMQALAFTDLKNQGHTQVVASVPVLIDPATATLPGAFVDNPPLWGESVVATPAPAIALDQLLTSDRLIPKTSLDLNGSVAVVEPPLTHDTIPTRAAPIPIWEGQPSFVNLPDKRVRITFRTMSNPNIIVFEDVLSEAECDAMLQEVEDKFNRSTTVAADDGSSKVHDARTSFGASFTRAQNALIERVETRLSQLANWPVERGEPIQVMRYENGQEYKPHFDYFDPLNAASKPHTERAGNRVATMIMYLSDVEEGGSTSFPDAGIHVMPKKGSVVFFSYGRAHEDSKSRHGGSPVIKGIKYIATKWLRERAY